MLKIGLTGGIGSGKSMVAIVFEKLGTSIFYADIEAKKFLENDIVKHNLREYWGEIIFQSSGEINKAELAQIVFSSAKELTKLNKLIHPLLMQEFSKWCDIQKQKGAKYVIIEAAILFEAGFDKFIDKSICVTAPIEQRIIRVMERDGASREQVVARMNNQWKQNEIIKKSDFEITNANNEMIINSIVELHEMLNSA